MKSLCRANFKRTVHFGRSIRYYFAINNSKKFLYTPSINPRVLDKRWLVPCPYYTLRKLFNIVFVCRSKSIGYFRSVSEDITLNKKYKISDEEDSRNFDELIFHMYADGQRVSVLKFSEV